MTPTETTIALDIAIHLLADLKNKSADNVREQLERCAIRVAEIHAEILDEIII